MFTRPASAHAHHPFTLSPSSPSFTLFTLPLSWTFGGAQLTTQPMHPTHTHTQSVQPPLPAGPPPAMQLQQLHRAPSFVRAPHPLLTGMSVAELKVLTMCSPTSFGVLSPECKATPSRRRKAKASPRRVTAQLACQPESDFVLQWQSQLQSQLQLQSHSQSHSQSEGFPPVHRRMELAQAQAQATTCSTSSVSSASTAASWSSEHCNSSDNGSSGSDSDWEGRAHSPSSLSNVQLSASSPSFVPLSARCGAAVSQGDARSRARSPSPSSLPAQALAAAADTCSGAAAVTPYGQRIVLLAGVVNAGHLLVL